MPIALRTRFFDDYLLRVVTKDSIRQVVLLVAGLDTRAFRLALPGEPVVSFGRLPYPIVPPTLPDFPHHWYVTARSSKVPTAK